MHEPQLRVEVGAVDWTGPGWLESFYPEALPEDWRAAYYANEYGCAGARWAGQRLADWSDGLPDGFALWLTQGEEALGPDEVRLARRALGHRLAGVWTTVPEVAAVAGEEGLPVIASPWTGVDDQGWVTCGYYHPQATLDLRAARVWLEAFAEAPGASRRQVLVGGDPMQVEQVRMLAELLGF